MLLFDKNVKTGNLWSALQGQQDLCGSCEGKGSLGRSSGKGKESLDHRGQLKIKGIKHFKIGLRIKHFEQVSLFFNQLPLWTKFWVICKKAAWQALGYKRGKQHVAPVSSSVKNMIYTTTLYHVFHEQRWSTAVWSTHAVWSGVAIFRLWWSHVIPRSLSALEGRRVWVWFIAIYFPPSKGLRNMIPQSASPILYLPYSNSSYTMCIQFIVSGGNKRRIRRRGLKAGGHGVTDDLPVPNVPGGGWHWERARSYC